MSTIYEVRSIALASGETHSWGARYSRAEAELLLAERSTGKNKKWADQYHQRWWIEEVDTTGKFTIPALPSPRERFSTRVSEGKSAEGTWNTLHVEILDEMGSAIANYDRNHPALYQTFEPFRQGDETLALISTNYTSTSVIDLSTGEIIAAEEPQKEGFCPAGFYVPDWWDVHDGSILPGSMNWSNDLQKPDGDFGFVWGCVWGDDSSWKVQYLDLSQAQNGKILRDERFGYIELAAHHKLNPSDFIECNFYNGRRTVTFATLNSFDLQSGARESSELG